MNKIDKDFLNKLEAFFEKNDFISIYAYYKVYKEYKKIDLEKVKEIEKRLRYLEPLKNEYDILWKIKELLQKRKQLLEKELEQFKKEIQSLKEKVIKMLNIVNLDPLTQVLSRVSFLRSLQEALERFYKFKVKFSFCLIDVDYFKKINDTYGHLAGDLVLRKIGEILKSSLRGKDLVGRYGGEEFGIILLDIDKEEAKKVVERIRKNVEKHIFLYEDKKIKVTISAGVTDVKDYDTINTLIKRADIALYKAKNNGRNRVEVL